MQEKNASKITSRGKSGTNQVETTNLLSSNCLGFSTNA